MAKKRENKRLAKYEQEELDEYLTDTETETVLNKDMFHMRHIELTPKQLQLMQLITDNKIIIATGAAGTSKTFTTCFTALKLLKNHKFKNIVVTKPTEIVGGTELGHLPGTLMEKLAVYMDSFIGIFSELLPGTDLKKMIEDNTIEFRPAQFMRGKTFRNCIVIVDEFQNFDIKTLMAIVTRLGENCTMVFAGDINQNDINKKYVAVNIFKEIIDGLPGTGIFEFAKEDIVRDKLLIDITDRYDKLKSEGKLPTTKRNT